MYQDTPPKLKIITLLNIAKNIDNKLLLYRILTIQKIKKLRKKQAHDSQQPLHLRQPIHTEWHE